MIFQAHLFPQIYAEYQRYLDRDDTPGHAATVRAFHRHFRGDEGDVLDAEDARILYALARAP